MSSDAATSARPIEVDGLHHHYGAKTALEDISFTLESGDFLALLGPNGAGKTTLFSLLTRLLVPREGRITLFGEDLRHSPRKALRYVGVVFQQSTLDLDLTVAQNLAYHGALHGMSGRQVRERMQEELGRFALADRANDRVRTLNGGHRRRVEIARALLHRPRLLLLDEASAGLDLESRHSLYHHVREQCTDNGLAVLWTTHLVEELRDQDATLILQKGKVIARGTMADLKARAGEANAADALMALTGAGKP